MGVMDMSKAAEAGFLDMCGKVVRKEGMGRDSSKLQYKVSLISLTQPLG